LSAASKHGRNSHCGEQTSNFSFSYFSKHPLKPKAAMLVFFMWIFHKTTSLGDTASHNMQEEKDGAGGI
jgi:hypothetical protein